MELIFFHIGPRLGNTSLTGPPCSSARGRGRRRVDDRAKGALKVKGPASNILGILKFRMLQVSGYSAVKFRINPSVFIVIRCLGPNRV